MYIVAIAWLYVTLMMALMEKNWVAGVLTFLFFGLAPCALLLWLIGSPSRRRRAQRRAANKAAAAPLSVQQPVDQHDGENSQGH